MISLSPTKKDLDYLFHKIAIVIKNNTVKQEVILSNQEKQELLKRRTKQQTEINKRIFPTQIFSDSLDNRLYFNGNELANILGLNPRYFSTAFIRSYEVNALIKKYDDYKSHYVNVPDEVIFCIACGFSCIKLSNEDKQNNFNYVYQLTKSTYIGFVKTY